MRHLYVYRFTYLIAALLVAAAALFAWLRSEERVAVPEEAGLQRLHQLPTHQLPTGSLSYARLHDADPKAPHFVRSGKF